VCGFINVHAPHEHFLQVQTAFEWPCQASACSHTVAHTHSSSDQLTHSHSELSGTLAL
jgi:hypothetical protein